jgi:ABC-type glycerol-3-phosphate transport system permease component
MKKNLSDKNNIFTNPLKRSALTYKISTGFFTLLAICLAVYTLYPYFFSVVASLRSGFDIYTAKFSFADLSGYDYE